MRRFLGVLVLASSLSACATIIHGGDQKVNFASTPSAATVFVDNEQMGVTPVTLNLSRKERHNVRIELAGYQPFETQLTKGVSGWVFGNLLFGGIPGLAIDAITGALYKLEPSEVSATLTSGRSSFVPNNGELNIQVVFFADPSWQKVGQLQPVDGNAAQ